MARSASTTRPSAAVQQLDAETQAAAGAPESTTPDLVLAAQKRAAAAREKDPEDRRAGEIDALLIERRGYVQRVALVDEQLRVRGVEVGA